MLIDGFTVAAQMINFVILMALLKRFLYQPILHAIDQREKSINATLTDVKAKQEEADQQQQLFVAQNKLLQEQRAGLIEKAHQDAKFEGQRLLEQSRSDADKLMEKRLKSLDEQEQALSQSLFSRAQREGFEVARHVLKGLGNVDLQDRFVALFLEKLTQLDDAACQALRGSAGNDSLAVLRSAFELNAEQRSKLERAVTSILGAGRVPRLESAPELIVGLELVTDGYKVSWNISQALAALESEAAQMEDPSEDRENFSH